MRYLILSCNTGAGHNSAADAVKDYFESKGVECDIRDSLTFISKSSSNLVAGGHVLLYKKSPKLFGVLYRFFENHPVKENERSVIYEILTLGAKDLWEYLCDNQYDGIICTHVFAGMMATAAKRKYMGDLKIYQVATDYTCTPCTPEVDAERFFIPHRDFLYEYVQSGIPSAKIIWSGIPVRAAFYEELPAEEAKEQLHLNPNEKIILLMCGSMGCGPIEELTDRLESSLPDGWRLIAICGSNRKLYEILKSKGYGKVTVVGFTKKMHVYMSAAEFALTKPGGLSSTEAFVKKLPLLLIDAVPGCETRNLEYFLEKGFAGTANSAEGLERLVLDLAGNMDSLKFTKKILSEEFGHAPKTIYDTIVKGNENETIRL